MAYENTKVVKTLRFPGDNTTQYNINAVKLEGHDAKYFEDLIAAVDERVDRVSGFDALVYVGTLMPTADGIYTPAADKGDVYKITANGLINGARVETGDILICNADNTPAATAENYITINNYWDIVQGNIDVEALLDHTHDVTVELTKTDKELTHSVDLTTATVSAEFVDGSATVNGAHSHTATGSVTITPVGTVDETFITPNGSVTLTNPATKGTGDVAVTTGGTVETSDTHFVTEVSVSNHEAHTHTGTTSESGSQNVSGTIAITAANGTTNYTPAGTINNSTQEFVTEVNGGETTISSHTVTEDTTGSHAHEASFTNGTTTAQGSVAAHKHDVTITPTTANVVGNITTTYTAEQELLELALTSASVVTGVSSTEADVAPSFTGSASAVTGSVTITEAGNHKHNVSVADHNKITPVITTSKSTHTHIFSGTGVQLVATPDLSVGNHTHTFTTAENTKGLTHVVSAPTAAHTHDFTGNTVNIHAEFTGNPAAHKHNFAGTEQTHTTNVTVNEFTGNFNGTASGNVNVTNDTVVTGVTVDKHTVRTVDSASATTGTGVRK